MSWKDEKMPVPLSQPPKKKGPRHKTIAEREETVRQVCQRSVIARSAEHAALRRAAKEISQEFAEKHATYYQKRTKKWQTSIQQPGVLGCCIKAAVQAEMLNTSAEEYVEAQFWFYDKCFSRPPAYKEIAATSGMLNWKRWKIAKAHGEVSEQTIHIATGGTFDPKDTPLELRIEKELEALTRMIRQWGSEEEVWGLMGDEEVFSQEFMLSRPIWRKMHGLD